jgi:chaperone protein DnaJ
MSYKLYETLGIDKNASEQDIKKAYKKMAMEFHPDKNKGNPEAETKFKEISNAYAVLSDENEKRKYDQLGDQNYNNGGGGGQEAQAADIFERFFGGNMGHPFAHHFEQHGGFEHHFNFNNFGEQQTSGVQKCKSFSQTLNMTLEEVYDGINKNIKISIKKYCSKCIKKCDNCIGRGIVNQVRHMGIFTQMFTGPCDKCSGSGHIMHGKKNCTECNGTCSYDKENNAHLTIPPGVDNGFKTIFPELGEQPKNSNQTPGDLILEINITPHKHFVRKGNDLYYKCSISFIESVVGKVIEIPLFKEELKININNFGVISNCKNYIIEGKGMPLMNSNTKKGNLFIEFSINYPKIKNTDKVKELEELLTHTFI